jgi:hypothetical protein
MPQDFDYDLPRVAAFMQRFLPGLRLAEGMVAIGLVRHARLVAGVVYEGLNRHNVWMHVAAEPGARWLTRDYLRACFAYPFKVCGHLGFVPEARLSAAAYDGSDVILYVMWRADCRFLET